MGHLAFVGSHRVNGVSALHTELMRTSVFRDFHRLYPDRIVNKTNGISFRRWLHQANPRLTELLCEACGPSVLDNPAALARLAGQADDTGLQDRLAAVKRANKLALVPHRPRAARAAHRSGRAVRCADQAHSRIQAAAARTSWKRSPAITRSAPIRGRDWVPARQDFCGQGSAELCAGQAHRSSSPTTSPKSSTTTRSVGDRLKLVFLPNYNVSLAEAIIPSADLSEQISTAGMEASGTGNMKLALNGALTIGTLDGANIEIRDHVGGENIFIFGLRAEEVAERRRSGLDATAAIAASPELSAVVDALAEGRFSAEEPHRFGGLLNTLRYSDRYMVAADFAAYREAQDAVDQLWQSPRAWRRAALLNIAGMSWFSSDRAIAEYARDIWDVPVSRQTR